MCYLSSEAIHFPPCHLSISLTHNSWWWCCVRTPYTSWYTNSLSLFQMQHSHFSYHSIHIFISFRWNCHWLNDKFKFNLIDKAHTNTQTHAILWMNSVEQNIRKTVERTTWSLHKEQLTDECRKKPHRWQQFSRLQLFMCSKKKIHIAHGTA